MFKKIGLLFIGVFFSQWLSASTITEVSAERLLEKLASSNDFVVLDVRSPEEYANGHIKGAVNIDFSDIAAKSAALSAYKNTEIVVYCRSGRRAQLAIDELSGLGFNKLSHLSGDMNVWTKKNLPLIK